MAYAQLDTPIDTRWIIGPDDNTTLRRKTREQPAALPGCPRVDRVFVWKESKTRYIVAISQDTRSIGGYTYGCYYVFPSMPAVRMFAVAVRET